MKGLRLGLTTAPETFAERWITKMEKGLFKTVLAGVLALSVGCSFCACKDKKTGGSDASDTEKYGRTYPIETNETLSYWGSFPLPSGETREFSEMPLAKQLEKETGVKIKYIYPTGSYDESFNLLLASGDLPDLVSFNWMRYPGGPGKAIEDGHIIPIKKYVDKYCPDFNAALDKYDGHKFFSTDDGELYEFPMIYNGGSSKSAGMMLRKDWLDELKLEVPETIDEWEAVLRAFKKKGVKAPLAVIDQAFEEGWFTGAFGIRLGYFLEDGKVKNGYMEKGYKEFITLMNRWYEEGLLDANYATTDISTIMTEMLNGTSGATFGGQGGTMGALLSADHDGTYELTATPFPVLKKGTKAAVAKGSPLASSQTTNGVAITTACGDVELAAKYLNYGYSEKGALTYGFGIEGVTYNMVDGYPTYTDLITKSAEGKSMRTMLDTYTNSASCGGPFIQDFRYLQQYAQTQAQREALDIWSNLGDGESYDLPPLFFDGNETRVVSSKQNSVHTYQKEMLSKFIIGKEPVENFDKYIETMKSMGADELIDAYQSAYERYQKR